MYKSHNMSLLRDMKLMYIAQEALQAWQVQIACDVTSLIYYFLDP